MEVYVAFPLEGDHCHRLPYLILLVALVRSELSSHYGRLTVVDSVTFIFPFLANLTDFDIKGYLSPHGLQGQVHFALISR